jgi:hypothetical protein
MALDLSSLRDDALAALNVSLRYIGYLLVRLEARSGVDD